MPLRTQAPAVKPFPPLVLPPESVELLPNGARLHSYRGGNQPIVRLGLVYEGGKAELGDAAARIIAAQLAEGTEEFDNEKLADIFDFNGVRCGALVSEHFTSIELNVLADRLPDVLPAFRSMVVCPLFAPDHLQVAKMQLTATIRNQRLQPGLRARQAFMSLMFGPGHHLAHVIDEQEIEAVSREALLQLHRSHICNAGLDVYVCGSFGDDVLGAVRDFVLSLPDFGSPLFAPVRTPGVGSPVSENIPFDNTMQAAVCMGMRTIDRSHSDYIGLRLAVMALGGYFGSRLMSNIREEKGLTYGIFASLCGLYDGAYMSVSAQCDKAYAATVVDEIRKEIALLADNPPCGDELERLRSYAMSGLAETLDTPQNIMGSYATERLVGTPKDYFGLQQREIAALTPERIATLARRHLAPSALSAVVVG